MAKKIKFESAKYRLLVEATKFHYLPHESGLTWTAFLNNLEFHYTQGNTILNWSTPSPGEMFLESGALKLFTRGDTLEKALLQAEMNYTGADTDPIRMRNQDFLISFINQLAVNAGFLHLEAEVSDRLVTERAFHDAWAESENVENIDVLGSNEVCTAPEMRYIKKRLGCLSGKRLLDVGCGLGEASVYFAILGAEVTASDLSQGMLDATARLANVNGVSVHQHIASAEDLGLDSNQKFDVIYAGNLLHHVNIDATLDRIKPHLKDDGILVTWDPLAYNPAINVYRSIATQVRTPDEHPLKWSDIKTFKRHFKHVETKYFWFFTLIIFVIMALAQRRNPNKERFWKVILKEGSRWAWLYRPLAALDCFILSVIPPFRLLCWNVVIIARK